ARDHLWMPLVEPDRVDGRNSSGLVGRERDDLAVWRPRGRIARCLEVRQLVAVAAVRANEPDLLDARARGATHICDPAPVRRPGRIRLIDRFRRHTPRARAVGAYEVELTGNAALE